MIIILFLFFGLFITLNKILFNKITKYSKLIIKKKYNYDIEQFIPKRKQSRSLIQLLREYFF